MGRKRGAPPGPHGTGVDLGGVFRGLGGFLDLLSEISDRGDGEYKRTGELGDDKKGVKAVYGFSVRLGGGGKPLVESFGNIKEKQGGGGPIVEETREPMVDVFEEDGYLLLVAELPGIAAEEIQYEVKEDVLCLNAGNAERRYGKEVLLPCAVSAEKASSSYRNGVFELKLPLRS